MLLSHLKRPLSTHQVAWSITPSVWYGLAESAEPTRGVKMRVSRVVVACSAALFHLAGGAAEFSGTVPIEGAGSTFPGRIFEAAVHGDGVGLSHASGDLDGDGHPDILIGAPTAKDILGSQTGKIYIFYGPFASDGTPIPVGTAAATIDSPPVAGKARHRIGNTRQMLLMDINCDGFDDVVLAPQAPNAVIPTISFAVFHGQATRMSGTAHLSEASATANGDPFLAIETADLDLDGCDDLIGSSRFETSIVPPLEGVQTGAVYITYGTTNPMVGDLPSSTVIHARIFGDEKDREFGASLAVGDADADLFPDLLVGAPGKPHSQAGAAFLWRGSAARLSTISVASSAHLTWLGATTDENLGYRVGLIDLYGDAGAELVLGAPHHDVLGKKDAGVYWIVGATDQAGAGPHKLGSPMPRIYGESTSVQGAWDNDGVGTFEVRGVGDLNGDHVADFLITRDSLFYADTTGTVHLFYGTEVTPYPELAPVKSSHAAFKFEDGTTDFGYQITAVGDANGDGCDDFLLGARASGTGSLGRSYLVFGDCSQRDTTPPDTDGEPPPIEHTDQAETDQEHTDARPRDSDERPRETDEHRTDTPPPDVRPDEEDGTSRAGGGCCNTGSLGFWEVLAWLLVLAILAGAIARARAASL